MDLVSMLEVALEKTLLEWTRCVMTFKKRKELNRALAEDVDKLWRIGGTKRERAETIAPEDLPANWDQMTERSNMRQKSHGRSMGTISRENLPDNWDQMSPNQRKRFYQGHRKDKD